MVPRLEWYLGIREASYNVPFREMQGREYCLVSLAAALMAW